MRTILFLLFTLFITNFVFSVSPKIEKVFLLKFGSGKGEIGPPLKLIDGLEGEKDGDYALGVYGMGLDPSGNLVFLDDWNKKLVFYNRNGTFIKDILGINGNTAHGYAQGQITFEGDIVYIEDDYFLAMYNIHSKELINFINPMDFQDEFHDPDAYTRIGKSLFIYENGYLGFIRDLTKKNSLPITLSDNDKILNEFGIKKVNGFYFLADGNPLFRKFSYYDSIYFRGNVNSMAKQSIGSWAGVEYWQPPIVWGSKKLGIFDDIITTSKYGVWPNFSAVLTPDGFIYFTDPSLKDGGTWVKRLDVKSLFPGMQTARITSDEVRIRSKPGLDGSVLGHVNKGDRVVWEKQAPESVTIDGQTGHWIQIMTEPGVEGWVFGAFVAKEE